MIFNSLRINNYRAYYGESIFDFPTEGERNISILYADNDVGKSCFFSAVLFCLYGPKDSDNLKDLINVNAQSEKSYHAEVSLFVENGKDKIEISRSIDLRGKLDATPSSKDFKCMLELIKNGVPLSSDEDEKADFIVTSPPYVTSYEYADLHQLPSLWFGYLNTLPEFREKFIGSMGSFAESIVDGAELKAVVDAIKSGSVNAVGEVKKVFKTAQSWLTLGKTIADTIGSGVSTTLKLTADGQLSGQDIGEIGFTSAIHGLDTLISGVTFGLFSCETILGKDVDTVVSDVKSWASNLSSNAAAYITNNPERLQEYNEAGPFKQACMTIGAIFAGNTKENRVKDLSEGISPAGGVVGFMSASRIPNMSPIYSSASGAGGGFSVGGGNGGGGGGAGAR